ncbi:MAG TPA: AMP-binding protein [Caulobacteraceae bacterium]|nr:AMP-binding protein [Caulobacteraceae bacterium]
MNATVLPLVQLSSFGAYGTLTTTLRKAAEWPPKTSGIICANLTLSYPELDVSARRLAKNLIASGVCPGDRIALHMHNGLQLATGYFACFYAGAIAVPVNTRLKGPEIEYVLGHSGASIYIGEPGLVDEIEAIRPRLANIRRFIVAPEDFEDNRDRSAPASLPIVAADRPAVILYTSGTTARPKGVVHTHRTLLNASRGCGLAADDVAVVVTPMVHAAGLATLIASVAAGASAVIPERLDADAVLDAIANHGGTFLLAMPVTYRALIAAQSARPRDLPVATRYLASGDSVPPALKEEFARCFGRPLREVFGATETGMIAAGAGVATSHLDVFGRAIPGVDIAVVNDDGDPVPLGATGEMIVRSAAVTVGYWNNPAATEEAIADGWYRTGDLVSEDFDGNLRFHGRKKEIIVRGGSNISPQEIEAVLYEHPAVQEAGVIGESDPLWGERVVAFVSRRRGHAATAEELIAFVAARVAAYKVPEEIVFLDVLPKGASGKILRRSLQRPGGRRGESSGRPVGRLFGRWRRGPDGQLVCTPEPKRARAWEFEGVWCWFAVAWLAAGYVLTGVAYFLG